MWIKPESLFDGVSIRTDLGLRVVGDMVAEVGVAPPDARRVLGCVSPGFIDLQVNGGGGVMLNTTPTPEGMSAIAAAHRGFGTVGIMPTVITDGPAVLEGAASAAVAAKGADGILGLHIEGPHIAPSRRGTHAARHIRPLDQHTMNLVEGLRSNDVTVMVTLAPEAAQSRQIAALAQMGAIVSLGHTDATAEQIEAAIEAGASCATHLFNAMSQMTSRAPGAVGAVLGSGIYAGVICDGHHVDDRIIRLALRSKAAGDTLFLVSDAMATVGGPADFELYGETIRLEDGKLINAEGALAGAHLTMAGAVTRLVSAVGCTLDQALRMAVSIPSGVINRPELAVLERRNVADCVVLNASIQIESTLDQALETL